MGKTLGCSDTPKDMFCHYLEGGAYGRSSSQGVLSVSSLRGLAKLHNHVVDVFLVVCSHHVSRDNDHYHLHSTCTVVCFEASLITMMVSFTCSHLYGPDTIGSTGCFSAVTVYCEGHFEGFCWAPTCATATSTSVPDAFSGIYHLFHGSSACKFLFQIWTPLIHMSCFWCIMVCVFFS